MNLTNMLPTSDTMTGRPYHRFTTTQFYNILQQTINFTTNTILQHLTTNTILQQTIRPP